MVRIVSKFRLQTVEETPCLERLLGLKYNLDIKWDSCIWSITEECWKNGRPPVLQQLVTDSSCYPHTFTRARSSQKWSIIIYGQKLPSLYRVQNRHCVPVGDELFIFYNPFLTHKTSHASYYSVAISMESIQSIFFISTSCKLHG